MVDALVRHGLAARAAEALYRLGLTLRRRTVGGRERVYWREHAAMVDARTGQRLGHIAAGSSAGVDIASLLQAAKGHRAAGVHTHPGSSSFSPDDAAVLVEEAALDVIAVVGADGTWYVLSPEPNAERPARSRIEVLYGDSVDALAPQYVGFTALGLTDEEIWQEHSHGVWQGIAPALGLRYDRIS